MKVVVDMVAPSSAKAKNSSGGWWYVNPAAVAFIDAVKEAIVERVPDDWKYYDVSIVIDRKQDRGKLACRLKVTLDALTHSGFWKDDRYVAKLTLKYGKLGRDRTTIVVKEAKKKWK